jgi:hypothetical protein
VLENTIRRFQSPAVREYWLKNSLRPQGADQYPCRMKRLRRSQAGLGGEVRATGYTLGCWRHGSLQVGARSAARPARALWLACKPLTDHRLLPPHVQTKTTGHSGSTDRGRLGAGTASGRGWRGRLGLGRGLAGRSKPVPACCGASWAIPCGLPLPLPAAPPVACPCFMTQQRPGRSLRPVFSTRFSRR